MTDAYGRVLAQAPSAALPDATLLAHLPAQASPATLYGRTGDAFGWLCTAVALGLVTLGWRGGGPQPERSRLIRRRPGSSAG